jgi:glycosyltransferase involved in cell wall biosynthesis
VKNNNTGKRIAIVASSAPPIVTGGISSAHFNLYKILRSRGFIVRVFTYTDHGNVSDCTDDISRHGAPYFFLKLLRIITSVYRYLMLRRESYEYAYQFYYVLESAIGSLKINKTLRRFAPDVVIIPDNGSPGFFIHKPENCRFILISHHNYLRFAQDPLIGMFSVKDSELAASFEQRLLKKVDKVICPSDYMKEIFKRTHDFGGPIAVIPNIIDSDTIESIPASDIRSKIGLSDEAPLVYIPSAGSTIKGSRYVFEIVRRLSALCRKEIGFYLSGAIDYDEVQKRELSFMPAYAKIHVPGYTSYFENISLVKACSFCISPTLMESFGMAILEANMCGLPVVAFDAGGNKDIIDHETNGFLVPLMDIEGLISRAEQLLEAHYLKTIRDKTVKYLRGKFAQEKIADRYISYIFQDGDALDESVKKG